MVENAQCKGMMIGQKVEKVLRGLLQTGMKAASRNKLHGRDCRSVGSVIPDNKRIGPDGVVHVCWVRQVLAETPISFDNVWMAVLGKLIHDQCLA